MRTIDESGRAAKPGVASTEVRLSPGQEGALLVLDGHWKAQNTLAATAGTMLSLVRHGMVERALRTPTPAYPKSMWWYRLTDRGRDRVRRMRAKAQHAKELERAGIARARRPLPLLLALTQHTGAQA